MYVQKIVEDLQGEISRMVLKDDDNTQALTSDGMRVALRVLNQIVDCLDLTTSPKALKFVKTLWKLLAKKDLKSDEDCDLKMWCQNTLRHIQIRTSVAISQRHEDSLVLQQLSQSIRG